MAIFAEVRALFGVIGAAFSVRRRRMILVERRQSLEAVFAELLENLHLIRSRWSSEHKIVDWRAWLHGSPLQTRTWRDSKSTLTTKVDGGPAVLPEPAMALDSLYDELDGAGGGLRFDWERRLVELAIDLRASLTDYPSGRWNRLASTRMRVATPAEIDTKIYTPANPVEMQRRMLEGPPRGQTPLPRVIPTPKKKT